MIMKQFLESYERNRQMIRNFLEKTRNRDDEYLFGELCFCLLTPQSRAFSARQAIEKLKQDKKLFTADAEELRKYLIGVRFPEKKVEYLIKARAIFPEIKARLNLSPIELRNWLAENVMGFGYKEASHFLRNIGMGFGQLGIIDVHIQNFMRSNGLFEDNSKTISKKLYLEMEKRFLEFSKKINIPAEELDIAIWLLQSRERNFYG